MAAKSNGQIKAIETVYKGYRFRSRLEARWAVFFDALGIHYRYELEGLNTQYGKYLPDFWLPHSLEEFAKQGWGFWVEIKSILPNEPEKLNRFIAAAYETQTNALLFVGDPWPNEYQVFKLSVTHRDVPCVFRGLQFRQDGFHIHLSSPDGFTSHPTVFGKSLSAAYTAARQARFEHGENGAPQNGKV